MDTAFLDLIQGAGGGCFRAGTLVQTPTGDVAIETLQVGDLVVAVNKNKDELHVTEAKVLQVHVHDDGQKHMVAKFSNGTTLFLTPNHWVWSVRHKDYVEFAELSYGDKVLDSNFNEVEYVSGYIAEYPEPVYNLTVADCHNYFANRIFVHNGGGGKGAGGGGGSFTEAPDSGTSKAVAKVLDLLSEGPIEGLCDQFGVTLAPADYGKGIYINNTPVINRLGQSNFPNGFGFDLTKGTPDQGVLTGFAHPAKLFSVGTPITTDPEVFFNQAITQSGFESVSVTVRLNSLIKQYTKDEGNHKQGDVGGMDVAWEIRLEAPALPHVVVPIRFNAKYSSPFQRTDTVNIPASFNGLSWNLKVYRRSPDDADSSTISETFVDFYVLNDTEQLTYPNMALVGIAADMRYFSGVPARGYHGKGVLVKIPDNYTPTERTYSGVWTGNFHVTRQWTNNPAWLFYEAMTNTRWGLGKHFPEYRLNKWLLYEISQYCDELVNAGVYTGVKLSSAHTSGTVLNVEPLKHWIKDNAVITFRDGQTVTVNDATHAKPGDTTITIDSYGTPIPLLDGGVTNIGSATASEPRFTCSAYYQTHEEAWQAMTDLASCFRAMLLWAQGTVYPVQDRDREVRHIFTNSDVIDGMFNYSGSALGQRFTRAEVRWNNPERNYQPDYAVYEDPIGIARYGENTRKVVAFGCTSFGQAKRMGKYMIYTDLYESEVVNFATGLRGKDLLPGSVFKIQDNFRAQYGLVGGRIANYQSGETHIHLDREITLASGPTYYLWIVNPADFKNLGEITDSGDIADIFADHAHRVQITEAPGTIAAGDPIDIQSAITYTVPDPPPPDDIGGLAGLAYAIQEESEETLTSWRVVAMTPGKGDNVGIVANRYDETKYTAVDTLETILPPRPKQFKETQILKSPSWPNTTPADYGAFSLYMVQEAGVRQPYLEVTWKSSPSPQSIGSRLWWRFGDSGIIRGTHTGADDQSVLTDSTKTWTTDEWGGYTLTNTSKGYTSTITANGTDTATASGHDWDTNDTYIIQGVRNTEYYNATYGDWNVMPITTSNSIKIPARAFGSYEVVLAAEGPLGWNNWSPEIYATFEYTAENNIFDPGTIEEVSILTSGWSTVSPGSRPITRSHNDEAAIVVWTHDHVYALETSLTTPDKTSNTGTPIPTIGHYAVEVLHDIPVSAQADFPGTHTGTTGDKQLVDSTQTWEFGEFIGAVITNTTKTETGVITNNNATTIFAAMTGDGVWDSGDAYTIKSKWVGTHTGANDAPILTDSSQSWTVNEFVGGTVRNLTDVGAYAVITANDATTITGTVVSPTDDAWDTNDEYEIDLTMRSVEITERSFNYSLSLNAEDHAALVVPEAVHPAFRLRVSAVNIWGTTTPTVITRFRNNIPATLTLDSVTENAETITLAWSTSAIYPPKDFQSVCIYSHTVDDFDQATKLKATIELESADVDVENNLDKYYWVTLVDTYGQESLPSNSIQGSPAGSSVAIGGRWNYDSASQVDGDPGSGNLRFDQTDVNLNLVTEIYVDDIDLFSVDRQAEFATWDEPVGPVKGQLVIRDATDPIANYVGYDITAVEEQTGYWKLTVVYKYLVGTLSGTVILSYAKPGDTGSPVGGRWAFDAATADADPGPGFLRFNSAFTTDYTLVDEIYIDDQDTTFTDLRAFVAQWDDAVGALKGYILIKDTSVTSNFAVFKLNAVTQVSGYSKLEVTYGDDSGAALEGIVDLVFSPAGDDSVTHSLTNDSFVTPADSDGTNYNLTGSGGTHEVFEGNVNKTTAATHSVVGGSGSPSELTQNGLKMSIVVATGVYTVSEVSADSWTTDIETFTLRATLDGVDYDKDYVISKAKAGADGVGTDAITHYLTQTPVIVEAAFDGTGYSLAGTGGTHKVFDGETDVTITSTHTVQGGATKNGLTMAVVAGTGVYSLSGASWTTDSETFTLRAEYPVASSNYYEIEYTISKAKAAGRTAKGLVYYGTVIDGGTHTSATPSSTVLTDINADWTGIDWTGGTIYNVTNSTSATITSNTDDTITGTLSSGQWDQNETYYIQPPDPDDPTAPTDYDFDTGLFTGLDADWQETPVEVVITKTTSYNWQSHYTVTENPTTGDVEFIFETPTRSVNFGTTIQSDNFDPGVSGWQLDRDSGNLEANDGLFRGELKIESVANNYKYHILGATPLVTFGLNDWDDANIDLIARDNGPGTSHEVDIRGHVQSPDGTTITDEGWQLETLASDTRAYSRFEITGNDTTDLRSIRFQAGDSPSTGSITQTSHATFSGVPIYVHDDYLFTGRELELFHDANGGYVRIAKGGAFAAYEDRALLRADANGGALVLYDDTETRALELNVTATGEGRVDLYNSNVNTMNLDGAGWIDFKEITAPAAPAADWGRLYMDTSDEHLYFRNSTGGPWDLTEAAISGVDVTGTPVAGEVTVWSDADTITNGAISKQVNVDLGSVSAAEKILDLTATWNDGADIFYGIYVDIVGTSADANSRYLALHNGAGKDLFSVRNDGIYNQYNVGKPGDTDTEYGASGFAVNLYYHGIYQTGTGVIRNEVFQAGPSTWLKRENDPVDGVKVSIGDVDAAADSTKIIIDDTNTRLEFHADSAEQARITGSGLLVNTINERTTDAGVTIGHELLIQDGTEALPGLAFASDPDTGIYNVSANRIGISTGDKLTMDIYSGTVIINETVSVGVGSLSFPSYTFAGDSNTGFYRFGEGQVALGGNSSLLFIYSATGNTSYADIIPSADVTHDLGSATKKWTSIYGDLVGNADSATLAATVTVGDAGSDTTTYVLLGGEAPSDQAVLTDTAFSYDASTNTITGAVTWNGNVIDEAYLDADFASLTATQEFTGNNTFSADTVINAKLTISDNSDPALALERTSAATNTLLNPARFTHTTSGNMADGFGTTLEFAIKDSTSLTETIAYIGAERTGGIDQSGNLLFGTYDGGVANHFVRIENDGKLVLDDGSDDVISFTWASGTTPSTSTSFISRAPDDSASKINDVQILTSSSDATATSRYASVRVQSGGAGEIWLEGGESTTTGIRTAALPIEVRASLPSGNILGGITATGGGTFTDQIDIDLGTITTDVKALDITAEYNQGATTFQTVQIDVTDTASGQGIPFVVKENGSAIFSVYSDLSGSGPYVTSRSLVPLIDDTYDLGSTGLRWKSLYLIDGLILHGGRTFTRYVSKTGLGIDSTTDIFRLTALGDNEGVEVKITGTGYMASLGAAVTTVFFHVFNESGTYTVIKKAEYQSGNSTALITYAAAEVAADQVDFTATIESSAASSTLDSIIEVTGSLVTYTEL